jgi:two-component system NarL family response regulator
MKRILLVDDHQMFREALRSLLERVPGLEVVGEAGNGLQVLPLVTELAPDIVCMDIGMPGMNGIETTRQLVAAFPGIKVIALSTHVDHIYVTDMMKAGAAAYVTKAEGGKELLRAIEAVAKNHTYWCPGATEAIARTMNMAGIGVNAVPSLGARELQVLRLVAEGLSSIEIAGRLKIAPATVDVHRRNIMRKLGLHSAVELTRYALSHGMLAE